MVAIWIAGALLLGLAAWRVGFRRSSVSWHRASSFSALGMEQRPLLGELAHAGVLLLLFAVGLKLRVKTLMRAEVWGTALLHLFATGVVGAAAIYWGTGLAWFPAVVFAMTLGFSSTVLAAKVLEGNRELRAVHGRVAIGILIVQDIVAVALLAVIAVGRRRRTRCCCCCCRSRGPRSRGSSISAAMASCSCCSAPCSPSAAAKASRISA